MGKHSDLVNTDIHVPYAYSYANEAARLAATGFVAADVGKLARQTDNDSLWLLSATTPTWKSIGIGGDVTLISFDFGDGASTIEVNTRTRIRVPWDMKLTGWYIHDVTPSTPNVSIVVDVRTGATYGASSSIAGSEKPTLSSANNNSDLTLSSWTTALSQGDFVWCNVDSVTGATQVELLILGVKT